MGLVNKLLSFLSDKPINYYDDAEEQLLEDRKSASTDKKIRRKLTDTDKLLKSDKSSSKSILSGLVDLFKLNLLRDAFRGSVKKPKGRGREVSSIEELLKKEEKAKTKIGAKLKSYKDPSKTGALFGLLLAAYPYIALIFDGIKQKVVDIYNNVNEKLIQPIKTAWTEGENFWVAIQQGFSGLLSDINRWWQNTVAEIKNFFITLNNEMVDSKIGQALGLTAKELVPIQDEASNDNDETDSDLIYKIQPTSSAEQSDETKDKVHAMVQEAINTTDNKYLGNGKYSSDNSKLRHKSESYCARHTIDAINSQLDEKIPIRNATDYYEDPSILKGAGFVPVSMNNYSPEVGDVIVEGKSKGHKYGHIQMYRGDGLPSPDGENRPFVSDFLQKSMNVHTDGINGPRQAWRYVGKQGASTALASNEVPNTNKDGLGGGSEDSSNQSLITGTTNNYYTTNNDYDSTIYVDYNDSVDTQR